MATCKVSLFGRFRVEWELERVDDHIPHKVKELLVFLLLYRDRPHPRERLAELLWQAQPPATSRKSLRQAIWKLKGFLECCSTSDRQQLLVESEWVQFHLSPDWELDVRIFETTFTEINPKRARELETTDFQRLEQAVGLYRGDLLEGWYQDWCIIERERFQAMYLMCLDKLVQYCEVQHQYDAGLEYATEILRCDRAYERTHRQMMRLSYMAGDRTRAIHQYQRCREALREELDIEPSERTRQLYEQIRADNYAPPPFAPAPALPGPKAEGEIASVLQKLEQFSETLNQIEYQVRREIQALTSTLSGQ
ncbi:MAG: hypothetical protein JXB85_00220 [Anaerolineales bacterium]|nr:hypothetical protein [Anaerolineales bacterium]